MADDDALPEGLYDSVVTTALLKRLEASRAAGFTSTTEQIDPADQADVLALHLGRSLLRSLRTSPRGTDGADIELANRVLDLLGEPAEHPAEGLARLLAVSTAPAGSTIPLFEPGVRPRTPLTDIALLTNTHGEPSLGSEIKAELTTSDSVDLLCAFVQWHGLRTLVPELEGLRDRGNRLRVVTTTYLGGTDRKALDRLARDFGAEVRVQYDPRRTRLHAKAWMFRRRTGFHTAYVGSSNPTVSALVDGAEWNVRLSAARTPTLLEKFAATFEAYWNSVEYQPYDPDSEADRERLDRALSDGAGRHGTPRSLVVSGLEVRPFPHQQQILEALDAERTLHDRHRNLVVAATGTGKTVVAALDYRNQARGHLDRPSLLFVAHRREILEQSLLTYRTVLGDGTFGELLVGQQEPRRWRHVFASVQSLTNRLEAIDPEHFDIVVIDEFHHAEARSYRRILDRLNPRELLGLTATPERADGVDLRTFFGGRTAAEIRIWDAINADLLSPFQYFGISDATDLRSISWSAGAYSQRELDNLYTGNDARARIVLTQLNEKVTDPDAMRALGFCAGVAHAQYMAEVFTRAGLSAVALSGGSSEEERARAIAALRAGDLRAIFTADLFNEGVDIPEVDTVLFLRPAESPTLFLQQLGRGLRLAEGKAVLTALDFGGLHRAEFRSDLKLRALTGATRTSLQHEVEDGFPFLPSGCQIVLDRVVQAQVLDNIRRYLTVTWPTLRRELEAHPPHDLRTFLADTGIESRMLSKRGARGRRCAARRVYLPRSRALTRST